MFVWADIVDLGYPRAPLSGPELADFRAQSKTFEQLGGIWSTTASLTGDGDPEQLRVATVTPDFFPLLGVRALYGDVLRAEHFGQPVRPVLLSHALWKRRFGADPGVVGRTITMNDRPALVVGVMPADFALLFPPDSAIPPDLQAWAPGGARPQSEPRGQQYLRVVGRLRPGVSAAAAEQEIAAIGADIVRTWPTTYSPGYRFYSVPMAADSLRTVRSPLLAIFAGVAILLVIATVNVAGLIIVRTTGRRRDAAVRIALGAARGRLFRQYLVEGLMLACAGGVVGVVLAQLGLRLLVGIAPQNLLRIGGARIDLFVLAFGLAIVFVWALLFSIVPIPETSRVPVGGALQQAGRVGLVQHQRTRRVLVVAQVALGVVLLVAAALLARTFDRLLRIDTGFSSDRILTFRIAVPGSRYPSRQAQVVFSRQVHQALAALPGVESVGAISHLPYDTLPNWGTPYLPEGETDPSRAGLADARNVAPGFFETVRARLVAGRWFTEADDGSQKEVAVIVDDLFAARVWPGQSPIGKALLIDASLGGVPNAPARVIGVVGHLRHRSLTEAGREQIFVSSRQVLRNPVAFVVRTSTDLDAVAGSIRGAIGGLDPRLPVYDLRPLDDYLGGARAASRFTLMLAALFAIVAVVLAAIGVYGVIAYSASARRREFGVRLALGAQRRQIGQLVLGEGLRLSAAGLTIGLVLALGAAQLLRTELYEVTPRDPIAYATAAMALCGAALLACWLPVRRATSADPQEVLRDE
jgi:predicted permease